MKHVKPSKGKGVFDVNKPGRVRPEATSRPIIVGHHPEMPDPMVIHRPLHHYRSQPKTPSPPEKIPISNAPISTPTIDGILAGPPPAPTGSSAAAQPPTEEPKGPPAIMEGEPLQSPPFGTPAKESHPPNTHYSKAPQLESVTPPADQDSQPAVTGADIKPLAIPAEHRRKDIWRWLLIFLVILLVGLYLLIDAGLIASKINLPFHIFKQELPPVYTPASSQTTASLASYEAKDFGFKFAYPSGWKPADLQPDSSVKTKAGKAYSATLTDKATIGLVSTDFQGATDNKATIVGFAAYESCLKADLKPSTTYTYTLYEKTGDVCLKALAVKNTDPNIGNYAVIIVQKKFTKSTKYAGLEMRFYQTALKDFTQKGLESLFTADQTDPIVAITKSVQEL